MQSMNGSPLATAPSPGTLAPGTLAPGEGAPDDVRPAGPLGRRAPWPLTASVALVCVALLLPVAFLIWQATGTGWPLISRLLMRRLTLTLLINTIELTLAVTTCAATVALGAAWCVERTNLPGRRVWRVLVLLPLAIPDFVVGYTWSSLTPAVHGLTGAVLVMTLGLYPLVYLPVAAALRRADSTLYEVARGLGSGRFTAFRRVVLPQIRPALLGGCLLVTLALLAEFGAFEILRFQTFTTEIFTEFTLGFNAAAASALSLLLVLLSLLALGGEHIVGRRGAGRGPVASARVLRVHRYRLGWATVPVVGGFAVLTGLSVGVPVSTVVYWRLQAPDTTLPPIPLAGAAVNTVVYAGSAAILATVAAFPVALLFVRHPGRLATASERIGYLSQGLPGLVLALALVFFAIHAAYPLYQTPELLVITYAIMFFPLALVSLRASLVQAPARLEETARSLGCRPAAALRRVTLPLVAPGIAASAALVFLAAVVELTATLVLIPTGANTLATAFWAYQQNSSYASASRYAIVIVAIAVIPGCLLQHWFDRGPGRDPGKSREQS
ncbi:MAG: iron ABC transporter permease [Streptosporangiaceae bacterium]|nr:iron ABC transporter permease [Streptosporangiaceae bacterium]